jgi:5-methylthioadenosine/S-adenosylhomocysteine deaminase
MAVLLGWTLTATLAEPSHQENVQGIIPVPGSTFSLTGRVWVGGRGVVEETVNVKGNRIVGEPTVEPLRVDGLILPGLIDLHDHLRFSYTPRFRGQIWPADRIFSNRYEWQKEPKYLKYMKGHSKRLKRQRGAFELYGITRELVGGTTTIINDVLPQNDSVLARNLCGPSKAHGLGIHIEDVVFFLRRGPLGETPPQIVVDDRALDSIRQSDLAFVHLAEGRRGDPITRAEIEAFFLWAENEPDSARKVIPVHLVGFERKDFERLKALGVRGVVWSPTSNLLLYGETMDLECPLELGLTVALGTDWYPSGSDSLFDELRCAKEWVAREQLSVDNETLNSMVLDAPAKLLGHPDLGLLSQGSFADFLVIPWRGDFESSLDGADVDNIELVVAGGRPLFGRSDMMEALLGTSYPSPIRPLERGYGFNVRPSFKIVKNLLEKQGLKVVPLEALGERYPCEKEVKECRK